MKKKTLIIVGIVFVSAVFFFIFYLFPLLNNSKNDVSIKEDTLDVSGGVSSSFFAALDENNIKYHEYDDNLYIIPDQVLLNMETDVYVKINDDIIEEVSSNYLLFGSDDYTSGMGVIVGDEETYEELDEEFVEDYSLQDTSDNDDAESINEIYRYSNKDMEKIRNSVGQIKKSFETVLSCEKIADSSFTPYDDTELLDEYEDDLDKAIQGLGQLEYSVRDESGRWWFLTIYSSYPGAVEASLEIYADSPDFQDFIPSVNMFNK